MPPLRDEFDIYNDTSDDIPAGGLALWSGGFTPEGALKVVKPTADSQPSLVAVGSFAVPARGTGTGSFSERCELAYDPAGGTPAQGDSLGSQAGSWYAKKGNAGFVCYGGPAGPWAACVRSIPAPFASPLTTKGDLWGYDTADARVPVGADGQVLTADSTQPLGVKWAGTGAVYGNAKMFSDFDITADGTFQDAGVTLTLPSAGTYIVEGCATLEMKLSATSGLARVAARLYDDTNSFQIAAAGTIATEVTGQTLRATVPLGGEPWTVSGAATIKLQGYRAGSSAAWDVARIVSIAEAMVVTQIRYRKL
jgi:hypothetical protein